jgi:calcineurin-like phosphoesterase family protein
MDVGVDTHDFHPWHFDEVRARMAEKLKERLSAENASTLSIIRYCNRPFRDVVEMDQTILERLNASVKLNDTLYFLGDFCIGG